jgi:hypothetical protein
MMLMRAGEGRKSARGLKMMKMRTGKSEGSLLKREKSATRRK